MFNILFHYQCELIHYIQVSTIILYKIIYIVILPCCCVQYFSLWSCFLQ